MDTQQQISTGQNNPVRREIEEVDEKIFHLESEIDIVPEAEQEKHQEELNALKTKRNSLQEKWDTIKEKGGEQWENAKRGLDKMIPG